MTSQENEDELAFLAGGGEMGRLTRAFDWETTPLGPIQSWPQSLRTAVSTVLNSAFPMYLAWGPTLVSFYNDAYRPILGMKPEALGRPFPEVWGEAWAAVGPIASSALRGQASYFEDLPIALERNGYREETWWTFSYSPIRDETGGVGGVLCVVHETTGEVVTRSQLTAERSHLRDLFRQSPSLLVVLRGPDHVFELVNDAYQALFPGRELVGRPVREALPEVASQGFVELLDHVYRTGEPFVGSGVAIDLPRMPDGRLQRRVFDFIYQPISDARGRVNGIFANGVDVTERQAAEERQKLLIDELNHRVKNTLATVQSVARQTGKGAPSIEAFLDRFEDRLVALSRTHSALTDGKWREVDVRRLLEQELRPYGPEQAQLEGPEAPLPPRQALALGMIFHELTTNAAKYGALSSPAGCVTARWAFEPAPGADELRLTWAETGGPPVEPPTRSGFGSRLIRDSVERDLNGAVRVDYAMEGFRCELRIPMRTGAAALYAEFGA